MRLKESAAMLIRDGRGRVLLVKRKKDGLWAPPAGHVEPGEIGMQAAIREAREETGMDIVFSPSGNTMVARGGWARLTPTRLLDVYLGEVRSAKRTPLAEDVLQVRWFTEDEIHQLFRDGKLFRPGYNLPWLVKNHTDEEVSYLYRPEWAYDKEIHP